MGTVVGLRALAQPTLNERQRAPKGPLWNGVSLGRLYPGAQALENGLLIAATEVNTDEDIEALASALEEALA